VLICNTLNTHGTPLEAAERMMLGRSGAEKPGREIASAMPSQGSWET